METSLPREYNFESLLWRDLYILGVEIAGYTSSRKESWLWKPQFEISLWGMHKKNHNQLSLFQKAKELPNRHVALAAYTGESYVVRALLFMFILCVAGYLYFVGLSILNVISSREASVESDRLQSVVGNLEQEYFELSKSVTPDVGASFGLVPTKSQAYVRSASNVASNVTHRDI